MSATLTRITGKQQAAAVETTIALNDRDAAIEGARFNYQAKLFALQQDFNARRDALRVEYHEALAEITGE